MIRMFFTLLLIFFLIWLWEDEIKNRNLFSNVAREFHKATERTDN